MPVLVFRQGGGFQEYYALDTDSTSIGRDEPNDVFLGDPSVSRHHAVIERTGGGFLVRDLGSKNGTKVNGTPVEKAALKSGDHVQFGDVIARFWEGQAPDVGSSSVAGETVFVTADRLAGGGERLAYLYELADATSNTETEAEFLPRALESLGRRLNCENVYVGLLGDGSAKITRAYVANLQDKAHPDFAVSRTILARVAKDKGGILVKDSRESSLLAGIDSVVEADSRSILCVPMTVGASVVGVLYADTRSAARPFGEDDLRFAAACGSLIGAVLQGLRNAARLREQNQELHRRLEGLDLVGDSLAMAEVREQIQRFARKGDAPVLILGESGTGKELAARMIHRLSGRSDKPFLDINCAAIPRELVESELFGHAKGAFTSATRDRRGLFQMADGGTLFLDEIGEMPVELQAKLLRVLETGEFRSVGSEKPVKVDVRIVAATNQDLEARSQDGGFRRDLLYRLNVLNVRMPPLREHRADIPILASHFLKELGSRVATEATQIADDAIDELASHDWPGNVRQLKNVIERALYVCEGEEILSEDIALPAGDDNADAGDSDPSPSGGTLEQDIEQMERTRIRECLERHRWNRSRVAAELGIARNTLAAKMKKYGLE